MDAYLACSGQVFFRQQAEHFRDGCNFLDPVWKRMVKLFVRKRLFTSVTLPESTTCERLIKAILSQISSTDDHVVRGKNDRVSSILQFENFFFQQFGIHRIESAERFVEDQKFRFVDDGDDKLYFLLHPFG